MSDYWLREATSLQATTELLMKEVARLQQYESLLMKEVARLQQYESMVHYIANDYIELSYDKAQWQRDDWLKRCRKTIAEAPPEWTENYGQGSEPWLGDKDA